MVRQELLAPILSLQLVDPTKAVAALKAVPLLFKEVAVPPKPQTSKPQALAPSTKSSAVAQSASQAPS